jgi:DNA polymerase-1
MIVDSPLKLRQMVNSVSTSEVLAIDTETNYTNSYAERFCLGISTCNERGEKFYIPVGHTDWGVIKNFNYPNLSDLEPLFKDFPGTVLFHNAKFDLHVLSRIGIEVPIENMYDTMIMSHLIDEEPPGYENGHGKPHSLESCGERLLGVRKDTALAKAMKKGNWTGTPVVAMAKYAEQDVVVTLELFKYFKPLFQIYEDIWKDVDRPFMMLLLELEKKGLPLDEDRSLEFAEALLVQAGKVKDQLGFDPAKPAVLQTKLFGEPPTGLGLAPLSFTSKKGVPQVNEDFLESCAHPVCALVLEYRRTMKQKSTYYGAFLTLSAGRSRIHPTFKQLTVTGRLSCEMPNLQQLPRETEVKKVFGPEKGMQLWEIDYRNLELRMAAVYAGQENLIEDFINEIDVHQRVADALGITRQASKIVNFLITYGGGIPALSKKVNITAQAAKKIMNDYRRLYPKLFQLMEDAEEVARSQGYVELWSGHRRHLHHEWAYRKAFNSLVQGGGFEIVKRSMLELERRGFDMRNQVHDSVWLMIPNINPQKKLQEAASIMSDWTEEAFGLKFSVDMKRLN